MYEEEHKKKNGAGRVNYAATWDKKNEITNAKTGKTCHIDGGSCNSKNVIYAAECI